MRLYGFRQYTIGHGFIIGGTTMSWMSRLQKSVPISTTKLEYMAIVEATKEFI